MSQEDCCEDCGRDQCFGGSVCEVIKKEKEERGIFGLIVFMSTDLKELQMSKREGV